MEIEIDQLGKRYQHGWVFQNISYHFESGKVYGIAGRNGSGKSTFLKIISGLLSPTKGIVSYRSAGVSIKREDIYAHVSIAAPYTDLIEEYNLSEMISFHSGMKPSDVLTDAQQWITMLDFSHSVVRPLYQFSSGMKQRVKLGLALYSNTDIIILDEPTSSLTANEVESLFRIMRELKEQGVALVYISPKMDEIKVIADEVTIMRDGHYIGKWNVAEMTKEQIIAKMVGRELSNLFPPLENHPSEEVMMKVEDFTSIHPRSFRHCSFELKKGEILGVAGLVGAQRTELMEGIFGLRAHTSGKVWIKGEEVNIKQPRDAIRKSVALLTEDRRATGIMGVLSVADNISIASLDALRKGPIMLDNKKILDLVATNKEKMAIKVPSPKTQIKSLSGGNQQKVLIARWLANNPDVLILDEPTRGIDVGAKYEIYCIIADLAKQGKSIIMISSEMSEIIGMSNRVMVMCDGRITGFINGKDATQENIMALATQFETAPDAAAANQ
jgi:methyl-galactoside transport system ATP-binding protein